MAPGVDEGRNQDGTVAGCSADLISPGTPSPSRTLTTEGHSRKDVDAGGDPVTEGQHDSATTASYDEPGRRRSRCTCDQFVDRDFCPDHGLAS